MIPKTNGFWFQFSLTAHSGRLCNQKHTLWTLCIICLKFKLKKNVKSTLNVVSQNINVFTLVEHNWNVTVLVYNTQNYSTCVIIWTVHVTYFYYRYNLLQNTTCRRSTEWLCFIVSLVLCTNQYFVCSCDNRVPTFMLRYSNKYFRKRHFSCIVIIIV